MSEMRWDLIQFESLHFISLHFILFRCMSVALCCAEVEALSAGLALPWILKSMGAHSLIFLLYSFTIIYACLPVLKQKTNATQQQGSTKRGRFCRSSLWRRSLLEFSVQFVDRRWSSANAGWWSRELWWYCRDLSRKLQLPAFHVWKGIEKSGFHSGDELRGTQSGIQRNLVLFRRLQKRFFASEMAYERGAARSRDPKEGGPQGRRRQDR